MSYIRELPAEKVRVETGAIRFGDDWPGMFIRGDNAMGVLQAIRQVEKLLPADRALCLAFAPLLELADTIAEDVIQ